MITLTNGASSVQLGCDLIWTDRNRWAPVVEQASRTLTGALVVEQSQAIAGRPITLESDSDFGLLSRATVDQLAAWAAIPNQQMTLDFHGEIYTVTFRYESNGAIDAAPVFIAGAPLADNYMAVKIYLRTTA